MDTPIKRLQKTTKQDENSCNEFYYIKDLYTASYVVTSYKMMILIASKQSNH